MRLAVEGWGTGAAAERGGTLVGICDVTRRDADGAGAAGRDGNCGRVSIMAPLSR